MDLEELPEFIKIGLFKRSYACLAIFNTLSVVEKNFLLRLMSTPCHYQKILSSKASSKINKDQIFEIFSPFLRKLNVLRFEKDFIFLEESFRKNLFLGLKENNQHHEFDNSQVKKAEKLTLESLSEFSRSKWEEIIKALLEVENSSKVSIEFKNMFIESKLISQINSTFEINNQGFSFILSSVANQIWFLVNYMIMKHISQPDVVIESILFLIYLATCLKLGKVYSTSDFTKIQFSHLENWENFGIVRFLKTSHNSNETKLFTITPLIYQIVKNDDHKQYNIVGSWFQGIIVESNFYLYAYTNSQVILSILKLFSKLVHCLPNMCVAYITRKSIRSAFKKGIRAIDIIQYLRSNRHKVHLKIQKNTSSSMNSSYLLATTLSDNQNQNLESNFDYNPSFEINSDVESQLILWEEERQRFQVIYSVWWEFEPEIDLEYFNLVEKHAFDHDYLIWSDKKKSFCIKKEGQESVANFYKMLLKPHLE